MIDDLDVLVRAESLLGVGRPRDALAELARVGAMASSDPDAWALISRCHLHLDEYDLALGAAQQVTRSDPGDGYGHLLQAIILNAQDRYREAVQAADQAVRLMPNSPMAHGHYGLALAHTGRKHRAVAQAAARHAVTLAPQDPDLLNLAGLVHLHCRNAAEARRHFEQALRVKPDHDDSLHNLGLLHAQKLSFGAAGANLGRSSALDPTAPENRVGFRFLLYRWLWVTHLSLFGVAFLLAVFSIVTVWMRPVTILVLLGLCVWAWWLVRGSTFQVRRALAYALRGSIGLTVWFVAVVATLVVLLAGQFAPVEWVMVSVYAARGLLVVGVIASWLAGRRSGRRRRS